MRRLRILTWHVHGSYMSYLAHAHHDFYLPQKPDRPEGYGGRAAHWPLNVYDVAADDVRNHDYDVILFQSRKNWDTDQHEILTDAQRRLPRIYLEHDPPREHPVDQQHWVDDPNVLLVHCTPFNDLMWDSRRTPTRVIDHGVSVPDGVAYTGELAKGIVVLNGMRKRARRAGADIFVRLRENLPLDLVGMQSDAMGGLGEIHHRELPGFVARYRFFFNPIRYTSMGLAVCEAMMLGLPIIGLATTEMATAIQNGISGYVDTNVANLALRMRELLDDPHEARRLGEGARRYAQERFGIERFARDWDDTFTQVAG